ncbi:hypothetical protein F5B19DRAFT_346875 [Rostrohypoxylon terebratum]|nr:hypothetical protein F5B19DRAFT_346875 [Rostrohypoxylon terebratum]
MAYRYKGNGYEDERRRSSGYPAHNSHNHYEFERDRGRDIEQGRYDRRDMRDSRDFREPPRSPYPNKKGRMGSPKRLHIDTKNVDGPSRSSSSTRSAASAFSSAVPSEPAAERVGRPITNSITGSANSTFIPKAKDSKIQDVFDAVYKWNKVAEDRALLKLQKGKLLREDQRRQAETNKISGKVDDYAPYLEFKKRFEDSGKAEREDAAKQLAKLDEQYAEELEKVVCAISSHAPVSPQAAIQTELISKLEDGFGRQQQQIQSLLALQQKSEQALVSLNQEFSALKSENATLKADLASLKSNYITLESDCGALKTENSELRQQIAKYKSTEDSVQWTQEDVDKFFKELQSFKARMDTMESKVHGSTEKIEDLDMESYNEIIEAWIDHDFKNKLLSHDTSITTLRQDLQSATSRLDKSETLIQETGGALQALEKARQISLQTTNRGETGGIKAFVEQKHASLIEVMQKTVTDSCDACAEMVDEVRARIDDIQIVVNTLKLATVPSKDPDMTAQVGALQQAVGQQNQNLNQLVSRIESMEGQRFGEGISYVNASLAELNKQVNGLQQSNGHEGIANNEAFVKFIKPDMDDAKKRLEALEMSVRILDSQWSNLSSKQMAERILQQLDPYGQRNEVRIFGVENVMKQMEGRLSTAEQNLLVLLKDRKSIDVPKIPPLDGKRHAASESPSEELMTKKRKLGANGQFAPQPHRSSSYNL